MWLFEVKIYMLDLVQVFYVLFQVKIYISVLTILVWLPYVQDKYAESIMSKYGFDVSSQPLFDGHILIQATGGLAKKDRIYGFGDRETVRIQATGGLGKKDCIYGLGIGRQLDTFLFLREIRVGPYYKQGHVLANDCHAKYQEDLDNAINKIKEQMEAENQKQNQEHVDQIKLNFEEQWRQMELDIEDLVYQRMLEMFSRGVRRDEQTRLGGDTPRWDNQPPSV